MGIQFYLASTSPRRKALCEQVGFQFECVSVSIDETPKPNEKPLDYVKRVALEKAYAAMELNLSLPVLTADTIVVLEDEILLKPKDETDAINMLTRLSNRTHLAITCVVLMDNSGFDTRTSITQVTFAELSRDDIQTYWDSGEPYGRAGSYAIQGKGALFVKSLSGSYSGVMGLPLFEVGEMLTDFMCAP